MVLIVDVFSCKIVCLLVDIGIFFGMFLEFYLIDGEVMMEFGDKFFVVFVGIIRDMCFDIVDMWNWWLGWFLIMYSWCLFNFIYDRIWVYLVIFIVSNLGISIKDKGVICEIVVGVYLWL